MSERQPVAMICRVRAVPYGHNSKATPRRTSEYNTLFKSYTCWSDCDVSIREDGSEDAASRLRGNISYGSSRTGCSTHA